MLKIPSPFEENLDRIRTRIWHRADYDTQKLVKIIRETAASFLEEQGYRTERVRPGVNKIVKN